MEKDLDVLSGSDSDESEAAGGTTLAEAKAAVESHPDSYESHLRLISLLRTEDLFALRQARDVFAAKFPLPPPVWLEWLGDEVRNATSTAERAGIAENLLPRVLADYMSLDLGLAAVRFQGEERLRRGEMSEEEFEEWFVRYFAIMGSDGFPGCASVLSRDFKGGAVLREAYEEQLGKADGSDGAALARSALLRAKHCCGQGFASVDSSSSPESEVSEDVLQVLGVFEEKLLAAGSAPDSFTGTRTAELVAQYAAYAASEEARDPTAAVVVWERCIAECFLHPTAWVMFAEFSKRMSKATGLCHQRYVHFVYARFARNIPWYLAAWTGLLTTARSLTGEERHALVTRVVAQVTPIVMQSDDNRGAERLSSAIVILCQEPALKSLRDAALEFNVDGSLGWCSVSALAASLDPDMASRSLIMEAVVSKRGGEARWWSQYAQLVSEDEDAARKIYARGLATVDSVEHATSIGHGWIFFEGRHAGVGDSERYLEAEAMVSSRLERMAALAPGPAEADKSPSRRKRAPPPLTRPRRKKGPAAQPSARTGGDRRETGASGGGGGQSSSQPVAMDADDSAAKSDKGTAGAGSGAANGAGSGAANGAAPKNSKPPQVYEPNVVYVNNLEYSVTPENLREAFQPAGAVADVRLPRRRDGAMKGFAYVEFQEESAVQAALALDKVKISGREVWVRRSKPPKPKPESRKKPPAAAQPRSRPHRTLNTTAEDGDAKMTEGDGGGGDSAAAESAQAAQDDTPRDQNDFRAMLGLTKK